jgi:hypothetical protein
MPGQLVKSPLPELKIVILIDRWQDGRKLITGRKKKKGRGNNDWPRPGNEVVKGTFPGPVLNY